MAGATVTAKRLTKFQRRVLMSIAQTGAVPSDIRYVASRKASVREMRNAKLFDNVAGTRDRLFLTELGRAAIDRDPIAHAFFKSLAAKS